MNRLLRNSLLSGVVTTAATTAALVYLSKKEQESAVAPLNAISHIAWGDEAFDHDDPDIKHTPVGFVLNALAVLSWSALHEGIFGRRRRARPIEGLVTGAAISGLAYAVDYHAVPERLKPGIERKLSSRSLFGVYASLALGLALGSWMRSRPRCCKDEVGGQEV